MQAVATWRKGHELLLEDGRAHSVVVDLPPEGGGTSAGTTPLELSVLSLAGSLTLSFVALARKRRLDFSGVTLALEGEVPSPETGLRAIHGTLRVRSRAARGDVDALLRSALEQCPVGRIFRQAQIPVNVVAVVAGARPAE
jgi:uncharacterized OsmC-like protein